jgi:hypothetical protein
MSRNVRGLMAASEDEVWALYLVWMRKLMMVLRFMGFSFRGFHGRSRGLSNGCQSSGGGSIHCQCPSPTHTASHVGILCCVNPISVGTALGDGVTAAVQHHITWGVSYAGFPVGSVGVHCAPRKRDRATQQLLCSNILPAAFGVFFCAAKTRC